MKKYILLAVVAACCWHPVAAVLYPDGTEKEKQRIDRALAIIKRTNPAIYNIVNDSKKVFIIRIIQFPQTRRKDSTVGNVQRLHFQRRQDRTHQTGNFSVDLSPICGVWDDDAGSATFQFSCEENCTKGAARKSIDEEEANTMVLLGNPLLEIDRDLFKKEFGRILAHEIAHAAFALEHSARAFFYKGDIALKGHDKGNPTGEAADKAEKEYLNKYGQVKKEIKRMAKRHQPIS